MKETLKTDYELLEEEMKQNEEQIREIDWDLDGCDCLSKQAFAGELEERNKEIYEEMEKIKKSNNYRISESEDDK